MQSDYLTVKDVSQMTGRTIRTVHKWCRSGKLRARKPGGRDYLIEANDFQEFMDRSLNRKEEQPCETN